MRRDSLATQVLAVLSRRSAAFQPTPDDPATFPDRVAALRPPTNWSNWLVPVAPAAIVTLVCIVVTVLFANYVPLYAPPYVPPVDPLLSHPVHVFDAKPVDGFSGFVGFGSNTTPIVGGAANLQPYITATPDPSNNGVRVVWTQDEDPDASQPFFYLQTAPDPNRTIDLSAYARDGGALLFDVVAYAPPPADSTTQLRMDCVYPCAGVLPATQLFAGLPVGQQVSVKIPLSCFASRGLNLAKVNVPLVLMSNRRMDVTFSNVLVEARAVDNADPALCREFQG